MCNATPTRCRWACGNQCAHSEPNVSTNETFTAVSQRYLSRRRVLQGGLAAGALLVLKATPLGASPATAHGHKTEASTEGSGLAFEPISLTRGDQVVVPAGYTSRVLLRWGDPLFHRAGGSADPGTITFEQQLLAFGYNCDYVGFLPLPGDRGVLAVNHEYTNPELMFSGYSADNPTKTQVDIELAAHGMSVVEIRRHPRTGWQQQLDGRYSRRIHGFTPIEFSGPAAGNTLLRTTEDPTGKSVLGMLNNCGAGLTPWGTVLTCEENFNQYFANAGLVTDPATRTSHQRYGLTTGASERKWERFYSRFDLAQEPNEAYRYGWVVEVDPADPGAPVRKHTALGRFKHEATSTVISMGGRAVVYMGDDERFDYMYKFVSDGTFDAHDSNGKVNRTLLENGTLYVARFHDDGSGQWLPLRHGEAGLTAENGFADQGEVLIKTRLAADRLGATKMDRPEDIEVNPKTGKVYAVMTNNSRRTEPNGPNPRPNNRAGHIIEITAAAGDHAAAAFEWDIFMLCGNTSDPTTYFAGYPKEEVSPIACPDNVTFDNRGNLWIATDGMPAVLPGNDGVFAVPIEGEERGYVRQFLSGVQGCEIASLTLDDSNETLFVTIQHPGEGSTFESPSSRWPDGRVPRPSLVFVTKDDGGTIGS
ncbi:MAG: PhoX family phosphatase [Dehalococcoidia bacterium]|nr:MAG: PhoX family phosphatase [Dehalococcoidia bacterium]